MTRPFTLGSKLAAILSLPLFLSGCVSAAQYASRDAGFTTVSAKTSEATGKQTAWVQNRAEARATEARVKTLMAASKTLDVETAVQVALLNNKGLQAAYADLGESAATAWQSTLLVNPSIGLGLTGIGTPGLRAYKTIEGVLTSNILALATLKKCRNCRYGLSQGAAGRGTENVATGCGYPSGMDFRRGGFGKRRPAGAGADRCGRRFGARHETR